MNVDYHASGDEVELAIRAILMDSKKFSVKFSASTTIPQRQLWFRRVDEIYQELGGGKITATRSETNPDQYIVEPRDDPENNY